MGILEIFIYAVCVSAILTGGITPEFKTHFKILSELVVYTWSFTVINLVLCGGAFNRLGIRPRTSIGLLGIFSSPFLHRDWEHLIGNTVPFFILGWLVMLKGIQEFFIVTVFIALFKGFVTWLLGRPYSNHFGASGIVLGYMGFLLASSYFTRDALSIVVTALVGFMYGRDIIENVLPQTKGTSWEGHFFGFIGGILAAKFLDTLKILAASVNLGF